MSHSTRNTPSAVVSPAAGPEAMARITPASIPSPPVDVRAWLRQVGGLSAAEIIEVLQLDQLARWRRGERVPAEAYLQLLAEARLAEGQTAVVGEEALDLVYAELLLRREAGEAPTLEEYLWRFPQYASQLPLLMELEQWLESDTIRGADPSSIPKAPTAGWPAVAGYEIVGELGRGGMGVVYKARQLGLQRPVALKVIRPGGDTDPEALARFRGEAEAVARLQHPNIVQIYEIGTHDGRPFGHSAVCPYMALEFVAGGSLAQRLGGTPQPARIAAQLVETLARAMHFAHQRGIIHRDLKPANILVSGELVSGEWSDTTHHSPAHHSPAQDHRLRPRQGAGRRRGSPDPDRIGPGDA
jgi:serine/threonine-protein kinase